MRSPYTLYKSLWYFFFTKYYQYTTTQAKQILLNHCHMKHKRLIVHNSYINFVKQVYWGKNSKAYQSAYISVTAISFFSWKSPKVKKRPTAGWSPPSSLPVYLVGWSASQSDQCFHFGSQEFLNIKKKYKFTTQLTVLQY